MSFTCVLLLTQRNLWTTSHNPSDSPESKERSERYFIIRVQPMKKNLCCLAVLALFTLASPLSSQTPAEPSASPKVIVLRAAHMLDVKNGPYDRRSRHRHCRGKDLCH